MQNQAVVDQSKQLTIEYKIRLVVNSNNLIWYDLVEVSLKHNVYVKRKSGTDVPWLTFSKREIPL